MARKFDLISELYERTCFAVTDNPVNWQSFLKTAGRNFRLRFDEQLLIYAQRPDVTAVLEIERWNGTFGRWVNRGAKGIAVFEDADRSRQRLIHYFDISDTHESRYSRPVPIWEMRPEYETEVIETIENTFGAVNDTTSIENVVKESISNAVEDNIADYISDFMSLGAGSDIEYLSADEANALYLELVRNSVSYMVMARLGLDADKVYSPDDFAGISSFNSQEVLNAVGIATSDIAEMALLPVSRTISTLSKENRIIDEQEQSEYNKDIKDERSQSNERNHIHDGGRLQSSEPEAAGADGISLINTLLGMRIDLKSKKPVIANKMGGFSGSAIKPVAIRMVYQVYEAVKIPIIGMGGISTAEDVIEMMLAGATGVQVGAANLVNPYCCKNIVESLPAVMEKYKINSLKDIIGGAH